jgi:PUA domain protein
MAHMEVKSRHHLRSDAIDEIRDALEANLGVELDADSFEKVELEDADWDIVLVDGDPFVFYTDSEAQSASDRSGEAAEKEPFVTVQGANAHPPEKHIVTVDAGAIQFVSDGADVMRPGIVEADDDISEGDLVVINEEGHGKFLAVGRALTDGDDMVGSEGRVVESIHHVGDDLFELTV